MKTWERILINIFFTIMCALVLILVCRTSLAEIICRPVLTEQTRPDGTKVFVSRDKKCYYIPEPEPSPTCNERSCTRSR
jgi:hypothetical protein